METRLEQTILKNLIQSETFTRKVIPFVKEEYFSEDDERNVYKHIQKYFDNYNIPPTPEALLINLESDSKINENILKLSTQLVKNIRDDVDPTPHDWLVDETEQWCKDRAIYIAVMDSIEVIDKNSKRSTGEIPELLKADRKSVV